ncbi:MAG TPA: glycine cleavage system protein GcvH [Opitutaceae bacterium]|jgi:glycine cleavage system H protein|nr:glycine cleavage system protein GcvH [Opitutaceae bacterium]HRE05954.1 glycine cleavage system protein GcvH [Opitutaceae bacterium]
MSQIPADLRYAKSHEWVRAEADGSVTVGITDYAQNSLGDITYVQLPKVGTALAAGAVFGVVESVKAASDLYTPVAGVVLAANANLEQSPETVNKDPFHEGWMIRIQPTTAVPSELLDATAYAALTR